MKHLVALKIIILECDVTSFKMLLWTALPAPRQSAPYIQNHTNSPQAHCNCFEISPLPKRISRRNSSPKSRETVLLSDIFTVCQKTADQTFFLDCLNLKAKVIYIFRNVVICSPKDLVSNHRTVETSATPLG
jgi:hypothetical protein